jgi:hypothetical protein
MAETKERDPRRDPQVGDRVMKNSTIRNVRKREGGDITYLVETGPASKPKLCWITTWQDWCKGAEVLA